MANIIILNDYGQHIEISRLFVAQCNVLKNLLEDCPSCSELSIGLLSQEQLSFISIFDRAFVTADTTLKPLQIVEQCAIDKVPLENVIAGIEALNYLDFQHLPPLITKLTTLVMEQELFSTRKAQLSADLMKMVRLCYSRQPCCNYWLTRQQLSSTKLLPCSYYHSSACILGLTYNPAGTKLAHVLSNCKYIEINEDANDDKEYINIVRLHGHTAPVHVVKWHPMKPILASVAGDNTLRLWNTDDTIPYGTKSARIIDQGDIIFDRLNFSITLPLQPEQSACCTQIINLAHENAERVATGFDNSSYHRLTWNHDGSMLAVDHNGGDMMAKIVVYDTTTWQVLHNFDAHKNKIAVLDWSNGGLASCSQDGTLKLWDIRTSCAVRTVTHNEIPSAMSWNTAGDKLAINTYEDTTFISKTNIWDRDMYTNIACANDNRSRLLAWQPHSDLLATTISSRTSDGIHLCDTRTGAMIYEMLPMKIFSHAISLPRISAMAWSPDGVKLTVGAGLIEYYGQTWQYKNSTLQQQLLATLTHDEMIFLSHCYHNDVPDPSHPKLATLWQTLPQELTEMMLTTTPKANRLSSWLYHATVATWQSWLHK